MVFKDAYSPFATAMEDAYNNGVKSTIETRKFIQSTDVRALFLKNEILYSAKLAMHLCVDKFVMADFDLEEGEELEVSINSNMKSLSLTSSYFHRKQLRKSTANGSSEASHTCGTLLSSDACLSSSASSLKRASITSTSLSMDRPVIKTLASASLSSVGRSQGPSGPI